jgi:hypothetical protein
MARYIKTVMHPRRATLKSLPGFLHGKKRTGRIAAGRYLSGASNDPLARDEPNVA